MKQLLRPPAEIQIHPSTTALNEAAAGEFLRCGREAVAQRGVFRVALAGGSTPRNVYGLLAAAHAADFPWEQTRLFFGDERTVPADDPNSNFRMVRESLLDPLQRQGRSPQVHRMAGELHVEIAARDYEELLRQKFALAPGAFPRFDLILLGMGTDGHTASLFPGTSGLQERTRLVVGHAVPQLQTKRITLTYPVLNHAAEVLFLSAGKDKAVMLRNVLNGDPTGTRYPSQDVQPASGRLRWMIDAEAGALLEPR